MGSAIIAARFLLAVVFATAGIGKLLDLEGSREALVGFGVPSRWARVGGTGLPAVELLTVVLLLVQPTAGVGAALALVLLLAFVAGIANALRKGETPDCHCFGALHSEPVGRGQIARNGVLAAIAVFVLIAGRGPSVDGWISARSAAELVAVLLGIATAALLAVGATQRRQILGLRSEITELETRTAGVGAGLATGTTAPAFAMPGAGGEFLTLESLTQQNKPALLIFVSAGCGPCESLVDEFQRWRVSMAADLTVAIVGGWTIERYRALQADHPGNLSVVDARAGDDQLDTEMENLYALFETYRLRATPSAVVVAADGTIGSATVNGRPAIEALLRLTLDRASGRGPRQTSTALA